MMQDPLFATYDCMRRIQFPLPDRGGEVAARPPIVGAARADTP